MLNVTTAAQIILDLIQPLDPHQDGESIDLNHARGRILAAPVISNLDFPHWDNSAMDGYAVRYQDVQGCDEQHPAILEIIETIPAGSQPQKTLEAGNAARIFTGAMMPIGADTVVMQEVCQATGDRVYVKSAPQLGQFVRKQAAYYQAGNTLLSPGIIINPAELAVLAAAQCTQVQVYRRPQVAIFSTGDELVEPYQSLQPGQLVDSNRYALLAGLQQLGVEVEVLGIVPDQPEALRKTMEKAITSADMVISSGGVSVGDYDYVADVMTALGGKIQMKAVAIKPGKPLTVAEFVGKLGNSSRSCLYFGLPGNPVSALVTFWRFVQPAIKKLSGLSGGWNPNFVKAISMSVLRSNGQRESYLWGNLYLSGGKYEFRLAPGGDSSGNLINLAGTNGLAMIPAGTREIAVGEEVLVLMLSWI